MQRVFVFFHVLLFLNVTNCLFGVKDIPTDPDETRTVPEFILSRGFLYETHYVTTKDGYILCLFRMINPIAQAHLGRFMEPVILQHGLALSASNWLYADPYGHIVDWINGTRPNATGDGLGFLLSNLGYDVWLSNARGNEYSRNHTHLDPDKDPKFWEFSFEQMIDYDAPAIIDYVLGATNRATVAWIGHSQGTLMIFGLLSTQPQYSEKIKPFIALAPVAYYGNIKGLLGTIRYVPGLQVVGQLYHGDILSPGPGFEMLSDLLCNSLAIGSICSSFLNILNGPDSIQLNETRKVVYIAQMSSTSLKNLLHYSQSKKSNAIRRWDHGFLKNLLVYGSLEPPRFPYETINSPYIVLMSSNNDYLADPIDVQQLREKLTVPLLLDYVVPFNDWSHLDFLYGMEAYKYVNSVVVYVLQRILPY